MNTLILFYYQKVVWKFQSDLTSSTSTENKKTANIKKQNHDSRWTHFQKSSNVKACRSRFKEWTTQQICEFNYKCARFEIWCVRSFEYSFNYDKINEEVDLIEKCVTIIVYWKD